jgi:hypothetical protein
MPNRTIRSPERDARFLAALAGGATINSAVISVGYARPTVYRWRAADVEFAAAWDDAVEAGTDILEDEALRRAKDGFDEPRFYEGQVCGYVRRYSDTLLMFLLKARRPGKYGDKVTAEHRGPGGGPITQIRRVILEPPSKSEDLSPC